jgi:hypothetical protein
VIFFKIRTSFEKTKLLCNVKDKSFWECPGRAVRQVPVFKDLESSSQLIVFKRQIPEHLTCSPLPCSKICFAFVFYDRCEPEKLIAV